MAFVVAILEMEPGPKMIGFPNSELEIFDRILSAFSENSLILSKTVFKRSCLWTRWIFLHHFHNRHIKLGLYINLFKKLSSFLRKRLLMTFGYCRLWTFPASLYLQRIGNAAIKSERLCQRYVFRIAWVPLILRTIRR